MADRNLVKRYKVSTMQDLRWRQCNIKTTALLGNVMHYQHGYSEGNDETILYNERGEMTEGSAVNAYIVKNGKVITPALDKQILPGITRLILLDVLRKQSSILVEERVVTMDELHNADEVWLSSSSKELVPVVAVDGQPVGDARWGIFGKKHRLCFSAHKYNY